ncbi:MAG TPA: hypothetical protein VMT53_22850 [Terriglobales bacterium]|nr:hypothetical protein [Terriglobales bacterium]
MMQTSSRVLVALVIVVLSVAGAAAQNKDDIQLLPTTVSGGTLAADFTKKAMPDTPSHKFLDAHKVVSISALTTLVAVDGVTTQHLIQDYKYGEMNPIARPLVTRGTAGQVVACSMGLGAAISAAYLFHKRGRHRLEKWTLRLFIAGESAAVINNAVKTP